MTYLEWFRGNFLSSVNPEILMSDSTYCFVTEQLLFIQKHDTTALVGSLMRIIQYYRNKYSNMSAMHMYFYDIVIKLSALYFI